MHVFLKFVSLVFQPSISLSWWSTYLKSHMWFSTMIGMEPLQRFYSCQQQKSSRDNNPSVHQFMHNIQAQTDFNYFWCNITKDKYLWNKDEEVLKVKNLPLQRWHKASQWHKTPSSSWTTCGSFLSAIKAFIFKLFEQALFRATKTTREPPFLLLGPL